jgi:hypothetical protein
VPDPAAALQVIAAKAETDVVYATRSVAYWINTMRGQAATLETVWDQSTNETYREAINLAQGSLSQAQQVLSSARAALQSGSAPLMETTIAEIETNVPTLAQMMQNNSNSALALAAAGTGAVATTTQGAAATAAGLTSGARRWFKLGLIGVGAVAVGLTAGWLFLFHKATTTPQACTPAPQSYVGTSYRLMNVTSCPATQSVDGAPPSPTATGGPYYVYILTNVDSPGQIWVGTDSDLQGKNTCRFVGGGNCAADGSGTPVQYSRQLGPYLTLGAATQAFCGAATSPHQAFGGTKAYIFGNSYFIDNVPAC